MEAVQEEGDKMEKKKISHQLLLNSPGACFLCLEDNQTNDEDLNGGIIDLNNICHYLNINQCSLLSTSLKSDGSGPGEEDLDLQQQQCSFSVNLCSKCLKLSEQLNDKIIEYEKAKLMVNYHLKSFHKVLQGNDKMNTVNFEVNYNSIEAKLSQLLRKEAKEKSLKILKKAEEAMPQVILSNCLAPPPPTPPSPPSTSSSLRSPLHFPPAKLGTSPSIKAILKHLISSNAILSSSADKSFKSKLYQCPYCTKIMTHSKIPLHLSCLHPSKLLSLSSQYFPPSSSPPPESICRQVLFKVLSKATKTQVPNSNPKAYRIGCHLCGITFSDGKLLRHHFLIDHTDKLCEEIKGKNNPEKNNEPIKIAKPVNHQLIKMENVKVGAEGYQDKKKRKLAKVTPKKKMSLKFGRRKLNRKTICGFCGNSFYQVDNLKRHQVTHHEDQLFKECKPGGMGEEEWREKCKRIFREEVEKATCDKPGGKVAFRCGYCPTPDEGKKGRSYGGLRGWRYLLVHLVFQHRAEMEGKLMGGNGEGDSFGGGNYMVVEEEDDGGDYDVKPDVTVAEEDDNVKDVQQQYGYFEEEDCDGGGDNEVDDKISNLTNEQVEYSDNYLTEPEIKMEVNQDFYFE